MDESGVGGGRVREAKGYTLSFFSRSANCSISKVFCSRSSSDSLSASFSAAVSFFALAWVSWSSASNFLLWVA